MKAFRAGFLSLLLASVACAQVAVDPGVRGGDPGAGGSIPGLAARKVEFFTQGLDVFSEVDTVEEGIGPRLNLDSCAGCHSQPAIGGTSPAINPQLDLASQGSDEFPTDVIFAGYSPPYGPIREVRFKFNPDGTRDGGVHNTATISGRFNTVGCELALDDFAGQYAAGNAIFRIPTPLFGAGLIEAIPDRVIRENAAAQSAQWGVAGHPNVTQLSNITGTAVTNGNDGTISRFGWKAQNQSLLLFSGEAYNVEMGITNELFQVERDETAACQFARVPNTATKFDLHTTPEGLSDMLSFALFMQFLAVPVPSPDTPGGAASIASGRAIFEQIGCGACHTPTLTTGDSPHAVMRDKPVHLFSDLLVHGMGPGLADDILQGKAAGDEFRTAPLWGLGQRIFFLHDGRTDDLVVAIYAHRSGGDPLYPASEANDVINAYDALSSGDQQCVLNFLRSL